MVRLIEIPPARKPAGRAAVRAFAAVFLLLALNGCETAGNATGALVDPVRHTDPGGDYDIRSAGPPYLDLISVQAYPVAPDTIRFDCEARFVPEVEPATLTRRSGSLYEIRIFCDVDRNRMTGDYLRNADIGSDIEFMGRGDLNPHEWVAAIRAYANPEVKDADYELLDYGWSGDFFFFVIRSDRFLTAGSVRYQVQSIGGAETADELPDSGFLSIQTQ